MKRIINFLKSFSLGALLVSLVCLLTGLSVLIWGDISAEIVCRVFGGVLVINALVQLVLCFRHDDLAARRSLMMFSSLIMAVIGAWMAMEAPEAITAQLIFVILSVILLYHGLMNMKYAMDLRNVGYKLWFIALLLGILIMAAGILTLIWYEKDWLRLAEGISFLFDGLAGFWIWWTIASVKRRAAARADLIEVNADDTDESIG